MILSIKFTSQYIFISEQSSNAHYVKVFRTIQADMPEGSYQKGVIIDTSLVAEKISEVLKENNVRTKKAIVTVNSVDMIQKEFILPAASEQHTRGMVENELRKSDILKNEYLFDFVSIPHKVRKEEGKKQESVQEIDTYLLPKPLVQNYIQTLQRAGLIPVRVKPFYDSMGKLVKLLGLEQKEELTILAYVESGMAELCLTGRGIKNIYRSILEEEEIFEESIFILSSKQNLYSSKDPEAVMTESLVENISKLVQFQMQSDRSRKVGQVLLYGELAQRNSFVEKIGELTAIPTRRCSIPEHRLKLAGSQCKLLSNFDVIASDSSKIVGENKELSFVKQYSEQRSGYITSKDKIPVYMMAVLLMIFVLAGTAVAAVNAVNRREIVQMEDELEQLITSQQYNENLIKRRMVEEYTVYNRICRQYIDILEEAHRLESDMLRQFNQMKPEATVIESYTFEAGAFVLNCKAQNQDGPAQYAKAVTDSGIFQTVEYTGFQLETDIEGNSYYRFQLKCVRD